MTSAEIEEPSPSSGVEIPGVLGRRSFLTLRGDEAISLHDLRQEAVGAGKDVSRRENKSLWIFDDKGYLRETHDVSYASED